MSTTPATASGSPWWGRWANFWFPAADPTTLGFMRICTGLLVLYIHLAYSLDLQAFFGKHGWYAASFIERERKESPAYVAPFWKWEDQIILPRLSDFPHRRQAMMQFIRALPDGKAERTAALAYLNRANRSENPDQFRLALIFAQNQLSTRSERENYLRVLVGGQVTTVSDLVPEAPKELDISERYRKTTPDFLLNLPPEERAKVADELRVFCDLLDTIRWADPERGRDYVFNYFIESGPDSRKALINYLNTLPEDPTERKKLVDYLDYWNSDPRLALRTGSAIFSIWFHVTDPTQMAVIHGFVLFLILLFTLGVFTRVTSVLVWVACIGYIHRTQQVLFGMDTMMNILLFYLMIGDSGAALSVDRLVARYRATRASLRRCGGLDAATRAFLACPPPSRGAGFAIRLFQVHFCFIYAAAGLAKLKGATWWNGVAFWEVLVNPEFTLLRYPWYEDFLRAVFSLKPFYYITLACAVWFTLFVEIALPFLVWTRLRWLMVFLATAMHAIIAVLMGLNLFELLMIVMLLAYLPDRVIRDRFRGGPELPKFRFGFNPADDRQSRAAALVCALDIDNQVKLVADPTKHRPEVTGADGNPRTGLEAVVHLRRGLRLLSAVGFLMLIPGAKRCLARLLFPTK
jgi:hypothetical protein